MEVASNLLFSLLLEGNFERHWFLEQADFVNFLTHPLKTCLGIPFMKPFLIHPGKLDRSMSSPAHVPSLTSNHSPSCSLFTLFTFISHLLLQIAKHLSSSGSLHYLQLLPETVFPQLLASLPHFYPSALGLNVSFSKRISLGLLRLRNYTFYFYHSNSYLKTLNSVKEK